MVVAGVIIIRYPSGSGLTGKGVTIAIVDPAASPSIVADVNTYMRRHDMPALRPGQLAQYLPPDLSQSCGTSFSPYGEEHLDVEVAHSMAPDANIAYVASDCTSYTDPLDAETEIVDNHLADIVSDSWHLGTESQMPAGLVPAFEQVFEQGAVEGIGFYFSSGDHGDWSPFTPGNEPAVQYPGSDPWVTRLFAQPFYQRGVVPSSLSQPAGSVTPMRVMPDIAADADPATGMLIGLTAQSSASSPPAYTETPVGGTSLSSPLIAGIQADAEQAQGTAIGFANPAIYHRYGTRAYHDVIDDPLGAGVTIAAVDAVPTPVPAGEPADFLVTMAHDTSLRATPGYDDVTGVGTPTAAYLRTYRRR